MPEAPRGGSASRPFAQPFQSPITDTRSAFGAQTAKRTPRCPPTVTGCAPSFR